ncbi:MAG: acylphosphatase [Spirochaetes bacterium]|nr:acylphosphatase [Spirochaetota bacterium]
MASTDRIRRRYLVTGRVQGVGFRQFVAEAARALALDGWVSNLPDGSVETEAEGKFAAIGEFEKALERGPALARVDSLKQHDQPVQESAQTLFEIRR